MKTKKFLLPSIFLAVTIIAYIISTLTFCYKTKPEISKGEFPFSITYEYKGETKKLSGVFKCEYSGSYTIWNEHRRYWDGEAEYDNPLNIENPNLVYENEELQTTLGVHENICAGYFMGDPLYKDYYLVYGHEKPEPNIEYYDHKNNITSDDENIDEILESIGFKLIDFTYAEPIENSFSFSGIQYKADNIIFFVVITILFFIACLIFVRRDKEYKYTILDKVGIGLNFLVGIVVIPFVTIVCFLFGITESGIEIVDQIIYNIPSISILCLALSVIFRRKGFSKTGFFMQFVGVIPFVIFIILDLI